MSFSEGNVFVELYDYGLSGHPEDRKGRVVMNGNVSLDDLVDAVVARRTELNAATLKMAYQLLHDAALAEMVNGASVQFGLGTHRLGVKGVFKGDGDAWDHQRHQLFLETMVSPGVRKAIAQTRVQMRGKASAATVINTVTDVTTGNVNERITPGGAVRIAGTRLKIVGEKGIVGVRMEHVPSGHMRLLGEECLLQNFPTRLMLLIPADVEEGDYRLSLTSFFGDTAKPLVKPFQYTYPVTLKVQNEQ